MSTPRDISQWFATELHRRRKHLLMSQEQAAREIGVSVRTVQSWEAGSAFPQARHRDAINEFLKDAA